MSNQVEVSAADVTQAGQQSAGETPPVEKPKKKKGRAKLERILMDYNFSGRISSLKLIGSTDQGTEAHFQLRGKKNRGKTFTVSASEPTRFTAAMQLLSVATARGSRLSVHTTAGDTEFRAVTQLILTAER